MIFLSLYKDILANDGSGGLVTDLLGRRQSKITSTSSAARSGLGIERQTHPRHIAFAFNWALEVDFIDQGVELGLTAT
jgi:hypothetical protein